MSDAKPAGRRRDPERRRRLRAPARAGGRDRRRDRRRRPPARSAIAPDHSPRATLAGQPAPRARRAACRRPPARARPAARGRAVPLPARPSCSTASTGRRGSTCSPTDGVYWMPVDARADRVGRLAVDLRRGQADDGDQEGPRLASERLVAGAACGRPTTSSATSRSSRSTATTIAGALALPHDGAAARHDAPLRRHATATRWCATRAARCASSCSASTCSTARRRSTTCCRSGSEPPAMADRLVPGDNARRRRSRRILRGAAVLAALAAVLAAAGCAVLSQPQFGAPMTGARLERAKANPQYHDGRFVNLEPETPTSSAPWSTTWFASSRATRCACRPRRCRCWRSTRRRSPRRRPPAACARSGSATPASMSRSTGCACCSTRCSPSACRPSSIGPKRFHPPPIALADLPKIDAVLDLARPLRPSRHGHGAAPGGSAARASSCRWASVPTSSAGACRWPRSRRWSGGSERRWGASRSSARRRATTPGRGLGDRSTTLWSSWSVLGPQHRFFYSGDTGYGTHFQDIGSRLGPFDLAFVKIGAYGPGQSWIDIHMPPEEAVQAHPRRARQAHVPGPLVDLQPRLPRLGRADPPHRGRGAPHRRRAGHAARWASGSMRTASSRRRRGGKAFAEPNADGGKRCHPNRSASTTAPPTRSSWARGAGSPATRSCAGSLRRRGWRWVDVGCGNGAFTEMLVERCAPRAVQGIDPSAEQLAFARARLAGGAARFDVGDAMALPYGDARFDAAVMALVIFFVPDPAKVGRRDGARRRSPAAASRPTPGTSSAAAFRTTRCRRRWPRSRTTPLWPPSVEAARMETLRVALGGRRADRGSRRDEIVVERTFADFDSFWRIAQTGPRLGREHGGDGERRPADAEGSAARPAAPPTRRAASRYGARANAIKGRVPA